MSTSNPLLVDFFDKIYIINLPSRQDRREEMQAELMKIGLSLTHPKIYLYPAVRPTSFEGWPNLGAKGCFMSHFQVLQDAKQNAYDKILIIEDDLNFVKDFNTQSIALMNQIKDIRWDVLYGGYETLEQDEEKVRVLYQSPEFLTQLYRSIPSTLAIRTTHFVAFSKQTIDALVDYLSAMKDRPAGDPNGGPMHVDGAYSWYRNQAPAAVTIVAYPQLGYQRSSATDIHTLRWYDQLPLVRQLISILRKMKNGLLGR